VKHLGWAIYCHTIYRPVETLIVILPYLLNVMRFSACLGGASIFHMAMQQTATTAVSTGDGSKVTEGVIWIHSERVSGAPCFINTRVPIQNLFDYLETGHTLDDFLEGFPPITKEQAVKVLELARKHLFDSFPSVENLA